METVYTIGYEGASLADFLATLQDAGIGHVLDVRELPQSRRPGFSKRSLTEALLGVGITYTHSKQLGDPKPGREAARRGDMDAFTAIFSAHLDLPQTGEALQAAVEIVTEKPTVLLCYERDPKCCHRALVGQRIKELHPLNIRHLGVRENVAARSKPSTEPALGDA